MVRTTPALHTSDAGLLGATSVKEVICFSFYRQGKATEEGLRKAIVVRVSRELIQ
jgi:hypothetical protein